MKNGGANSGATQRRELSLASRTLPEAKPEEMLSAAAAADFDACGIWVQPERWDRGTTRAVRERLADTGMRVLDVEVLALTPDVPDDRLDRIVAIGAELGARYALAIATEPDPARTSDRFARLCESAAPGGIRVCLEFMRFTSVRTLTDALAVVRAAGHPAGAVLVDMLHLIRSGGDPDDLSSIDPALLPYTQICDAPLWPPNEELGTLIDEALNGRLLPGEGGLPVAEILAGLPADCSVSCEILSSALRERHPDPTARAKAVAKTIRSFLARADGSAPSGARS
jgi:sugar phosphate isomerase/epimerase